MITTEINVAEIIEKINNNLIPSGWSDTLHYYLTSKEFEETIEKLIDLKKSNLYFCPKIKNVFRWLEICPHEKVKAILFSDCAHKYQHMATGIPLQKPTKWMELILNTAGEDCNTENWAKQGVLLIPISPTRTVEGENHYSIWTSFISYLLNKLNELYTDVPYVLIGRKTYEYLPMIKSDNIKLFSLWPEFDKMNDWAVWTNEVLRDQGKKPIRWE